jgi:hypothetical protein
MLRPSKIVGDKAGVLGDPREHAWTDLIAIMESENIVGPSGPLQDSM